MRAFAILPAVLLMAQAAPSPPSPPAAAPLAPSEIVAAAPAADWTPITADDLLVMDLAPGANRAARRVVIQLMPAPFSQGWIGNIRKLAAAHWWDGTSVNRVQDNYVAQWGDADGENRAKAKPLPPSLETIAEKDYVVDVRAAPPPIAMAGVRLLARSTEARMRRDGASKDKYPVGFADERDAYAEVSGVILGWPMSITREGLAPVHCYSMVGVGRNLSPDTGSGAELYTVIGHAPRHLDRNIALVGRVVEGIEHLSSLPRGTEALGFYKTAAERTPILRVRMASELPVAGRPRFEYLSTESATFARYADARANRRDAFFIRPAGGADICNVPVPVRRMK
jgi:cyclophilin family peptidyl-prolyl cis-trans isomerase